MLITLYISIICMHIMYSTFFNPVTYTAAHAVFTGGIRAQDPREDLRIVLAIKTTPR